LVPDKDCSGVTGGDAVVDECGICGGFGKTGCDSTCGSTLQLDCTGECGGNAKRDCNNICNGNHHLEYFCEESDSLGITLDLSTHTLTCFAENENGNCGPNTNSCSYVDCDVDTIFTGTVIDCNFELPICDSDIEICADYSEYKGDGECDFEITNCEEFEFDDGDCNLIDCSGLHFSNDLCVPIFGAECLESLDDTFCDDGNDDVLPLNFNCEGWSFDGAKCMCEDENNGENDCWVKTSPGNYVCPSEGVISGGDCSD